MANLWLPYGNPMATLWVERMSCCRIQLYENTLISQPKILYWNPNVITDSQGHAHVEFYNNSYTQDFHVTGAGITASGIPYVLETDP